MTNRITEGFDWFPSGKSSADRSQLWASNSFFEGAHSFTTPADVRTGRFDFGKAISWDVDGGNFANRRYGYVIPLGVTVDEVRLGFAFFRDRDATTNLRCGVGVVSGAGNNCHVFVSFEKFGVIRVYRGYPWNIVTNPGTGTGPDGPNTELIGSSIAGAFEEDEWFHCEIYIKTANTGGQVEVRINTVPKVQITDADTVNGYMIGSVTTLDSAYIGFGNEGFGLISFAVDDLFVNDTAGSTMNTWAGNLRVKTQFVIADGFVNDFTIGGSSPAATNWQSVLNQNLDDTEYVYSSTVGDIDLYDIDPILNAPFVRVLQVRMGLRQDDATQRVARAVIRIGGVNYEDNEDQYTNQTYTFYKGRWELSPATGVSFTGAEVNGLEAGIKVQA